MRLGSEYDLMIELNGFAGSLSLVVTDERNVEKKKERVEDCVFGIE